MFGIRENSKTYIVNNNKQNLFLLNLKKINGGTIFNTVKSSNELFGSR